MHLLFEVTRETGVLRQTIYEFVLYGSTFVLSSYREQYKSQVFGGWRIKKQYHRVIDAGNSIEAEQITIPDDVKKELIERFTQKLTVTIWPVYKKQST